MCSLYIECTGVSLIRMYGVFSIYVEYVECVLFCAWNMAALFHAIAAKLYVECVLFMYYM